MTERSNEDERRLADLIEVVIAIAAHDFRRRAEVGDGSSLFDGIATGLNMLAEEIRERAARERAFQARLAHQERLIAVGQLAAGVAHEINNPATFVLMNLAELGDATTQAAALLAPGATAEQVEQARQRLEGTAELIDDNRVGVERIVAIVRQLRFFARVEPEKMESVALADVVNEACALVRAEVAYRAQFVVEAPSDVRVRADRARLVQVFTNLLLNARQAIPEGAVERNRVEVRVAATAGHAVVTVTDTGTGMSDEVARRIFEPFFTTKSRALGTGLGLPISADVARAHGGELRLVRTSPAGTSFEVSLPLDESAARTPSAAQGDPVPAPAAALQRRPRVMLIDDEAMLLQAYGRFLGRDYDLTLLGGGKPAVETLARDGEWDVILCDLMMSDLDGAGVSEWIDAHRPELASRTLFCTGGAFTPRTAAFATAHAARLLEKPLGPKALREAVARVLAASAAAGG